LNRGDVRSEGALQAMAARLSECTLAVGMKVRSCQGAFRDKYSLCTSVLKGMKFEDGRKTRCKQCATSGMRWSTVSSAVIQLPYIQSPAQRSSYLTYSDQRSGPFTLHSVSSTKI